jgi:ABC-2 type transport system ATP-binding protein
VNRPLPNQSAVFDSAVLENSYFISGSSSVSLQVSAVEVVPEATLFVSLRIVGDGQRETLPNGLVTPVRVFNVGPDPQTVEVELPTIVQEVNPGEKLRIVVTTTDFGYRMPLVGAQYEVALADNTMQLATANNFTNLNAQLPPLVWIAGALLMALLIGIGSWLIRPRNKAAVREDLLDVPVRIENLAKEFKGGLRAVNDITWEVPAGKVIGLLGPNGAGKTTTMRMIMGLIRPTEGEIFVYGNKVAAGSPVLSQIGSLVEGAGFLPHLTGRENLDLYWKASGRSTEDPHLDAVLAIADLGTALDRKVRTYSQGMRQRLGISQAMLGMPKLLMLDEPTNGLDPPQIRAMREMLMSYADTGRTVIVSSHLLSEVEQTCSHVIVMHRGQLVTTGRVDELLEGKSHLRLEDFFLEVVGDDLTIGKQA